MEVLVSPTTEDRRRMKLAAVLAVSLHASTMLDCQAAFKHMANGIKKIRDEIVDWVNSRPEVREELEKEMAQAIDRGEKPDVGYFYLQSEYAEGRIDKSELKAATQALNKMVAKYQRMSEKMPTKEVLAEMISEQGEGNLEKSLLSNLILNGEGNCHSRQKLMHVLVQRTFPELEIRKQSYKINGTGHTATVVKLDDQWLGMEAYGLDPVEDDEFKQTIIQDEDDVIEAYIGRESDTVFVTESKDGDIQGIKKGDDGELRNMGLEKSESKPLYTDSYLDEPGIVSGNYLRNETFEEESGQELDYEYIEYAYIDDNPQWIANTELTPDAKFVKGESLSYEETKKRLEELYEDEYIKKWTSWESKEAIEAELRRIVTPAMAEDAKKKMDEAKKKDKLQVRYSFEYDDYIERLTERIHKNAELLRSEIKGFRASGDITLFQSVKCRYSEYGNRLHGTPMPSLEAHRIFGMACAWEGYGSYRDTLKSLKLFQEIESRLHESKHFPGHFTVKESEPWGKTENTIKRIMKDPTINGWLKWKDKEKIRAYLSQHISDSKLVEYLTQAVYENLEEKRDVLKELSDPGFDFTSLWLSADDLRVMPAYGYWPDRMQDLQELLLKEFGYGLAFHISYRGY